MLISEARLIYQHKIIFEKLNLPFHENQWTGILGPSGVGKSSLLRMIAQLPIQGDISYQTEILQTEISYMTQSESLLPWLSLIDNILIGLKLRKQKITTSHFTTAKMLLDSLGLLECQNRKPSQLSGGQKQRAGLARTLFENKNIILLDEPFSSLDTPTKQSCYTLFKGLLKNKTVIFVTHDPLEALKLGDHLYRLSGKPAQLTPVVVSSDKSHLLNSYDQLIKEINA
jgi:putative hydroxymethylpyrimidine transport system ATP-binding protein